MLVPQLQGVDDTEDLIKVASGLGRVGKGKTDDFLWINDENGANGEGDALCIDIGGIYGIKHVV